MQRSAILWKGGILWKLCLLYLSQAALLWLISSPFVGWIDISHQTIYRLAGFKQNIWKELESKPRLKLSSLVTWNLATRRWPLFWFRLTFVQDRSDAEPWRRDRRQHQVLADGQRPQPPVQVRHQGGLSAGLSCQGPRQKVTAAAFNELTALDKNGIN